MGNIKTLLFKKPEPIRALFLGLDSAGKTTILYSLKLGEVITTIPTIGFNVETLEHKGLHITAWDVGGRDKIRPLYRHYFDNMKIVIFVIDSNDRDRLGEAKNELYNICGEEKIKNSILLVLANKQDLEGAMSVEEIKKSIDFENIPLQVKQIFGTVAIKKESLEVILDWIQDNYEKESNQITQPVVETYSDIKEITRAKSWIEYLKKITQQIWMGIK